MRSHSALVFAIILVCGCGLIACTKNVQRKVGDNAPAVPAQGTEQPPTNGTLPPATATATGTPLMGCANLIAAPSDLAVQHPNSGSDEITIDFGHVVRVLGGCLPLGINLNYLHDDDANRPQARPLAEALGEMGVHFLRYPGGEKSDFHFFAPAPYDHPNPQVFGWYVSMKQKLMDFDKFMAIATQKNMIPYIVVPYESSSRGEGVQSHQAYLDHAVAWVKYANITKKYGIKYWEIGNENWNNHTGTARDLAGIVAEFSKAMKAVDPSIKIGASGNNDEWWSQFLPIAGGDIDFLVVSNYPAVSGYTNFMSDANVRLEYVSSAAAAIDKYAAEPDKKRLAVVATEFNMLDWSKQWADSPDLGHALVNFDIIGQLLEAPRMLFSMFWTTRWQAEDGTVINAVDHQNNLTLQGIVLSIWGNFMQEQLVQSGRLAEVNVYASRSPALDRRVIFLLNKESTAHTPKLILVNGGAMPATADRYLLVGKGPTDQRPGMAKQEPQPIQNGQISVTLPPYSITVIDIK